MKETVAAKKISEWQIIFKDPWLLSLTTWILPLLFLAVYAIFSHGLSRDLPIGIVDLDHSQLSRTIISYYDANPTLSAKTYTSMAEGIKAMQGGEIYGLIVLPLDMEKDIVRGSSPKINSFYNSQFLLIGKLVKSAVFQTHTTIAARIDSLQKLKLSNPIISQAMAAALPISIQTTPLFNSNNNYAQFLVSAIIPAIWQIVIVISTILSLAKGQETNTSQAWLSPNPISIIRKKLLPYTIIFWLHGVIFLLAMVAVGWPMNGSIIFLVFCQLLMVLACQSVGMLFFFLGGETLRSLSLASAYVAPALAFMGVTFPVTDMGLPARIWRSLLPVAHYIDIQIAQTNYGTSPHLLFPQIGSLLLLFMVPALISLSLIAKQINNQSLSRQKSK